MSSQAIPKAPMVKDDGCGDALRNSTRAPRPRRPAMRSRIVTFDYFSKLPMELRHMIFTIAASFPRVVVVDRVLNQSEDEWNGVLPYLQSRTLAPAVMHATVESRSAASKVYNSLHFGRFTGTYVNWDTDWILFINKAEHMYASVKKESVHKALVDDLILKVQRIASTPNDLVKFVRVRSDRDGKWRAEYSAEEVLIYPSLEEMAVVETVPEVHDTTDNWTIIPKQTIPLDMPEGICPFCAVVWARDGWPCVRSDDDVHEELLWGELAPVDGTLRSQKSKDAQALLYLPPKPPRELTTSLANIPRLPFSSLQSIATARGLECSQSRKDLVAVIQSDVDAKRAALFTEYRAELEEWAAMMLGYRPLDESQLDKDAMESSLKAIQKYLKSKGL